MQSLSTPSRSVALEGLSLHTDERAVHDLVADYGQVEVLIPEKNWLAPT